MPFDLVSILGYTVGDGPMLQLLEYFEEQPRASEREPELGDSYYLSFPDSGFSLLLNGKDVVETIHVYVLGDGDHRAYGGELPSALTVNTSQAQARSLFGPPSRFGGPMRAMISSGPVTYWDRWDYEHHSLYLQYPEQRDSISLLTLAVIEPATMA